MAAQLTDAEREDIAARCKAGESCRDIATAVGRSPDTVSRIAKDIGHTFGHPNLARARAAQAGYAAEVRAEIASAAAARAKEILAEFDATQPHVTGFGEVVTVQLDARGQKDRAQAAQLLTRTVLDIARVDEKRDDGPAKGLLERMLDALETDGDVA